MRAARRWRSARFATVLHASRHSCTVSDPHCYFYEERGRKYVPASCEDLVTAMLPAVIFQRPESIISEQPTHCPLPGFSAVLQPVWTLAGVRAGGGLILGAAINRQRLHRRGGPGGPWWPSINRAADACELQKLRGDSNAVFGVDRCIVARRMRDRWRWLRIREGRRAHQSGASAACPGRVPRTGSRYPAGLLD